MKYFFNKITAGIVFSIFLSGLPDTLIAADTVCDTNGGLGYPIADFGTTNLSIPFDFGDISVLHDIDVSTDINHTWVGDLTVRITSPDSGTQITLFERPGTPDPEFNTTTSFGCRANDINAIFDDESANPAIENEPCAGTPVFSGDYKPHDAAPNNLSIYDGENPNGNWSVYLSDSANQDTGTLNRVCLTVAYAAVTFDKWVSTNNTCSDTLDTLSVTPGSDVYYCYIVSNPSTETFTINPGDTTDNQGHNISALETTYAQGTSQTVVIGPISAASAALPDNVTTVNNAQVTATFATANFNGTLVTSETASLTVTTTPPPPPASGVKQLYFDAVDTGNPDLTRDPTDALADTQSNNIGGGNTFTLNQGIVFASPLTLSGGNDVIAQIWIRRRGGNGARTLQVELFNGNTGVQIGAANQSVTWTANRWQIVPVPITIAADTTLAAGDFIRVVLTNTSTNNRAFQIRTLRNGVKSQLQMQSGTVINVDSINVYDAPWPSTVQYSSYIPGSTVYIRAPVSDPFGNADITSAKVTIDDPNSPPSQLTNAAMTSVATPTTASRLYEYSYVIPATPEGFWPLSATANEGLEATVSHTGTGTMIVGTANITISKNSAVLSDPVNATDPKAIPGAIVEYTISVNNAGYGYINTDSIVLTDPVATGTTFFFGTPVDPITFIDGVTASGLTFTFTSLASTSDDIDFSNDGGATFITPTTDASGFDTTTPAINFIRINPKGEFNGGDTVNNPSMEIKFRVRVQ